MVTEAIGSSSWVTTKCRWSKKLILGVSIKSIHLMVGNLVLQRKVDTSLVAKLEEVVPMLPSDQS